MQYINERRENNAHVQRSPAAIARQQKAYQAFMAGYEADKLKAAHTRFVIEPHVRFEGEVGEQATMFFLDPSGNALEFKAFKDMGQLFAK